MSAYLVRRTAQTLLVILGVSIVSFGLMFLSGDPTEIVLGPEADRMTQEQIQEFRHKMGFDQPWYIQYGHFLSKAVRGDFGLSLRQNRPSADIIIERIPATVELATVALVISVVIGIPLGVVSAVRRNSGIDVAAMIGALLGQSVPNFWLGLVLMLVFGVTLRWLPISGRGSVLNLIMPAITLAVFYIARNARMTRSAMLEVLGQEYVRTARAKGLAERVVIYKHALRNALLPVVTVIGLQLGALFSGAVIVETVFAWPGIGRATIMALTGKDFTVVQASVTMMASAFAFTNLVVDLIYGVLDPRVRYS